MEKQKYCTILPVYSASGYGFTIKHAHIQINYILILIPASVVGNASVFAQ